MLIWSRLGGLKSHGELECYVFLWLAGQKCCVVMQLQADLFWFFFFFFVVFYTKTQLRPARRSLTD